MKASGHIIIIITSYQEFPGIIVNPFDDRHTTPGDRTIHEAVDGYLHCFRCALLLWRLLRGPVTICALSCASL